jgi:hypothetical protein
MVWLILDRAGEFKLLEASFLVGVEFLFAPYTEAIIADLLTDNFIVQDYSLISKHVMVEFMDNEVQMSRWIAFLIVIALGAAAGMLYGWVINPVGYVDTAPNSLRNDYKTDYVLMIAEAYTLDQDISLAARRLASLGDLPPSTHVDEALAFAVQNNYAQADMLLMRALAEALDAWNPSLDIPAP